MEKWCEICRIQTKDWTYAAPKLVNTLGIAKIPQVRLCLSCNKKRIEDKCELVLNRNKLSLVPSKSSLSSSILGNPEPRSQTITFECPICLTEGNPMTEVVQCTASNNHRVCKSCLEHVLQNMVQINKDKVKCFADEKCSGYVQPNCFSLLSDALQKRLQDPLLSGLKKILSCPFCKTEILVPYEQLGTTQCNKCLIPLCVKCKQVAHPGVLCQTDEDTKLELDESLRAAGVSKCPHCFTPALRTEACSTVKCSFCQTSFCDFCNGTFHKGTHTHRQHFCRMTLKESPGFLQPCQPKCLHCPVWDAKSEANYKKWKEEQNLKATTSSLPMDVDFPMFDQKLFLPPHFPFFNPFQRGQQHDTHLPFVNPLERGQHDTHLPFVNPFQRGFGIGFRGNVFDEVDRMIHQHAAHLFLEDDDDC
jgi:hypothetical protein